MGNQRFSITPSRAISDKNMPDGVFRTLAAIGVYGDKNGWCWPSLSTLAKDRGVSKAAISQHVKWLKENNYLNVHARYDVDNGTANRRSNRYQIKFDYRDTESEGVLSSELNTPLSSELNTVVSSGLNVNAPSNAPKERHSADAEKVSPSVTGIGWAIMADRKVNDADISATRGQTNESSAASWRNAGLNETLVQIAYTFAVSFGKAMPAAPQGKKDKAPIYYVWKEGAEKLQTIQGQRDRLHVIRELGAEYNQSSNGFGTVTNPASILNKVYDKMNETAQVLKPDNGTIRM